MEELTSAMEGIESVMKLLKPVSPASLAKWLNLALIQVSWSYGLYFIVQGERRCLCIASKFCTWQQVKTEAEFESEALECHHFIHLGLKVIHSTVYLNSDLLWIFGTKAVFGAS